MSSRSQPQLVSSLLDERWFLYQNPRTGTVSVSPLSLRQLIKLVCPPREGMSPLLPATTQCLSVSIQQKHNDYDDNDDDKETQQHPSHDDDETQVSQPPPPPPLLLPSYGEWKSVNEIDILKQASCQEWYWTISGSQQTHGPGSCRMLVEAQQQQQQQQQQQKQQSENESTVMLVFAQGQTSEWTDSSKLQSLQLVMLALSESKEEPQKEVESNTIHSMTQQQQHPTQEPFNNNVPPPDSQEIQDELEAFLMSTDDQMKSNNNNNKHNNDDYDDDDGDGHAYESDGGTQYIKDPRTGNWIHEALAPPEATARLKKRKDPPVTSNHNNDNVDNNIHNNNNNNKVKKKKKRSNFSKRNAKNWIYITGLPTHTNPVITTQDVHQYFAKVGMLDLDPETLQPKIKLYQDHHTGQLKGDASVCYARPESVELALQVLDDSLWDAEHRIKVQRAHFQAKGDDTTTTTTTNENGDTSTPYGDGTKIPQQQQPVIHAKKKRVSEAQRKVARLALLQAQDDGFGERLAGGRKGLRIIVLKGLMQGIPENALEDVLHETLEQHGPVEKITAITKTQVVIVKYAEPIAASEAVEALHDSVNPRTQEKVEAIYWDGVTDYTKVPGDDETERLEEQKRHEEFGNWLESQEELPPELRLQVAGEEDCS